MTDVFNFTPRPWQEAVKTLENRSKLVPSGGWQEWASEEHKTMFTVAQSTGFDILGDVFGGLMDAQKNGQTFEHFRKNLTPLLQNKGWWGRQDVLQPDGSIKNVQLGSDRRLETIYSVNMQVAAARGRFAQIDRLKKYRPYMRYCAICDAHTRPLHRAWHGTILPIYDVWWATHYPPNGWRCRCSVISVSSDDLDRFGWKVNSAAPSVEYRDWLNKRTGQIERVPVGIDPGWAYHVGKMPPASMLPPPTRKTPPVPPATPAPKAKTPPKSVVHNPIMPAIRPRNAPAPKANIMTAIKFAEFVEFVEFVDQAPKIQPKGEIYPVGSLKPFWIDAAKTHGIELETPRIAVRDQDIAHSFRDSKNDKLPRDWYKNLPHHLKNPDAVILDKTHPNEPALLLIYKGNDKAYKLVVRLNYNVRKKGIMNIVETGRPISKHLNMIRGGIGKGYVLLEGSL